jgi:hypothetical protein
MTLQLKRAKGIMHSQQMASIALSVIGCIDYLAYGTIFTRVMFRPKKKLIFIFPPEKPEMSPGEWWLKKDAPS